MIRHRSGLLIIIRGSVGRLGVHGGVLSKWRKLISHIPDLIAATSSGADVALAALPWNELSDRQLKDVIGKMTRDDICVYEPKMKFSLQTLLGAIGFMVFALLINKILPWWAAILVISLALTALVSSGKLFLERGRAMKAPFTTDPLRRFLRKNIDFRASLMSPIKLKVFATNILTSESVPFSTTDEGYSDPDDPAVWDRWVEALVASSSLLLFPPVVVDSMLLGDGEFKSDLPIEEIKKYRHVVVLDYWVGAGLRPTKEPDSFLGLVFRTYDIMRDTCNQNAFERYELERKYVDPDLPELFFLRASPELMKSAPDVHLLNMGPVKLQEAIEFGEKLMEEQAPKLREYLKRQTP